MSGGVALDMSIDRLITGREQATMVLDSRALFNDGGGFEEEGGQRNGQGENGCRCGRSKCLKQYCGCFRNDIRCTSDCVCTECHNDGEHEGDRKWAVRTIRLNTKDAFKGTDLMIHDQTVTTSKGSIIIVRGCRCTQSSCTKKYCDCFAVGLKCGDNCVCEECQNGNELGGPPKSTTPKKKGGKKETTSTPRSKRALPEPKLLTIQVDLLHILADVALANVQDTPPPPPQSADIQGLEDNSGRMCCAEIDPSGQRARSQSPPPSDQSPQSHADLGHRDQDTGIIEEEQDVLEDNSGRMCSSEIEPPRSQSPPLSGQRARSHDTGITEEEEDPLVLLDCEEESDLDQDTGITDEEQGSAEIDPSGESARLQSPPPSGQSPHKHVEIEDGITDEEAAGGANATMEESDSDNRLEPPPPQPDVKKTIKKKKKKKNTWDTRSRPFRDEKYSRGKPERKDTRERKRTSGSHVSGPVEGQPMTPDDPRGREKRKCTSASQEVEAPPPSALDEQPRGREKRKCTSASSGQHGTPDEQRKREKMDMKNKRARELRAQGVTLANMAKKNTMFDDKGEVSPVLYEYLQNWKLLEIKSTLIELGADTIRRFKKLKREHLDGKNIRELVKEDVLDLVKLLESKPDICD